MKQNLKLAKILRIIAFVLIFLSMFFYVWTVKGEHPERLVFLIIPVIIIVILYVLSVKMGMQLDSSWNEKESYKDKPQKYKEVMRRMHNHAVRGPKSAKLK